MVLELVLNHFDLVFQAVGNGHEASVDPKSCYSVSLVIRNHLQNQIFYLNGQIGMMNVFVGIDKHIGRRIDSCVFDILWMNTVQKQDSQRIDVGLIQIKQL